MASLDQLSCRAFVQDIRRRASPSDHDWRQSLGPGVAPTPSDAQREWIAQNSYVNAESSGRQGREHREERDSQKVGGHSWLDIFGGALFGLCILVAAKDCIDVTYKVFNGRGAGVQRQRPQAWTSSDHSAPPYPRDAGLQSLLSATEPGQNRTQIAPNLASFIPPLPEPSNAPKEPRPFTHNTIADAAAKAAPAVVNISSLTRRGLLTVQNEGSGFIIQSAGVILTNAHVVISNSGKFNPERPSDKLMVTLEDGRIYEGKVLCFDTHSDIALIRVFAPGPLPTVELGQSATLRPGDWVLALGSPHNLPQTVTAGIISCVDRSSTEMGLTGNHSDYLQTDAAVNQGNSGGPLVNLDGKVIGINTLKLSGTVGVSFAIPIDTAVRVVEQLVKYGHVRQPFLGIRMYELNEQTSEELRKQHGGPVPTTGVYIAQVIPGSPAARGGLMAGDVMLEFDGVPMAKVKQVLEILVDRIGVEMEMKVNRMGKEMTLVVTPEETTLVK